MAGEPWPLLCGGMLITARPASWKRRPTRCPTTGAMSTTPPAYACRVNTPLNSTYTLLTPIQTYGLKTGTSNALVETVNPLGVFTNERADIFKFKMDRFGNVLSSG